MVAIPFKPLHHGPRLATRAIQDPIVANYTPSQLVVEAWAEGFNFGGLIVLVLFVLCNYRRGVILHKLILLEVSRSKRRSDLTPPIKLTRLVGASTWTLHLHILRRSDIWLVSMI